MKEFFKQNWRSIVLTILASAVVSFGVAKAMPMFGGFSNPQQYIPSTFSGDINNTNVTTTNLVGTTATFTGAISATTGTFNPVSAYNYYSSLTKGVETLGANVTTDFGLETWTSSTALTNWADGVAGPPGGSLTQETDPANVQSGTSSAKLDNGWYIAQVVSGLTVGDNYRVKFYLKGAASSSFFFLNNDAGSATKIYNFTNNDWNDNWTGSPSSDNQINSDASSTAFVQITIEDVPIPTGGKITPVFIANTGDTIYIDTITIQKVNTPANITMFDFYNPSDSANLTSGDYLFKWRSLGGTPATVLALRADGLFETVFNYWNFGTKGLSTTGYINGASSTLTDSLTVGGLTKMNAGQGVKVRDITTATTSIAVTDYIVHVTRTSAEAVTTTLPTAGIANSNTYFVIDAGNNAAINNIVIDTEGAEKINTQDSISITSNQGHYNIYSDGTNWWAY